MMGFNPRDLRRMMKKMGISLEELKAVRVVVELEDGSRLVVEEPQAMVMKARGQPPVLYVSGEMRREEPSKGEEGEAPAFTEEDVALVAEQAGVSLEEARRALEETGGDIAEAILRLTGGG